MNDPLEPVQWTEPRIKKGNFLPLYSCMKFRKRTLNLLYRVHFTSHVTDLWYCRLIVDYINKNSSKTTGIQVY